MNETPTPPKEYLVIDDTTYSTIHTTKFRARKPYSVKDPRLVLAFIPGIIQNLTVSPGQRMQRGQSMLTLEAMKMKNDVTAPIDGTIKAVLVKVGDMVTKNQLLVEFE